MFTLLIFFDFTKVYLYIFFYIHSPEKVFTCIDSKYSQYFAPRSGFQSYNKFRLFSFPDFIPFVPEILFVFLHFKFILSSFWMVFIFCFPSSFYTANYFFSLILMNFKLHGIFFCFWKYRIIILCVMYFCSVTFIHVLLFL